MPDCLLQLCAHVEAFRPIAKRWQDSDYSDHVPPVEFPRQELRNYLDESYKLLKAEQQKLLEKLRLHAKNDRPAPRGTVPLDAVEWKPTAPSAVARPAPAEQKSN